MEEATEVLCNWRANIYEKLYQQLSSLAVQKEFAFFRRFSLWSTCRLNVSVCGGLHHRQHCRPSLVKKRIIINMFNLLLLFSSIVTCQGVSITSGPENQTIMEGGSAHFECVYEGSDLVPSWRINTIIYSNSQLPRVYELNNQDFSLTVRDVPASLNFTAFQCVVGIHFSDQGYLFVEPIKRNTTECVECTLSTSNSPTEEQSTTVDDVNTGYPATSGNRPQSGKSSAVVSVTVSLSFLLCVLLLGGFVLLVCLAKRRKAGTVLSGRDDNIKVEENNAYAAIEKYRKPIRVQRNEAYETTVNVIPNRCRSPQA